jgi:hypothetical protein
MNTEYPRICVIKDMKNSCQLCERAGNGPIEAGSANGPYFLATSFAEFNVLRLEAYLVRRAYIAS